MTSPAALRVVVALAALAALGVAGWSWQRLARADADRAAAHTERQAAARDLRAVALLRAEAPVAPQRRPDADLVSRAQQALLDAGLRVTAFAGIQPRADQPIEGGVRLQTVVITLQRLRPADLGAWLAAWSVRQPPWTITDLQMIQSAAGAESGKGPGNVYDTTLVLAALYSEESP